VPRDDYVDLPGCPSGVCKGKIKQAYGLAYQQTMDSLSDSISQSSREQTAREAGRKAEIDTVRRLLGLPIDHFIEVTLGAFFQIAQVVQPITVCLNEDTSDSYSGADFHRGVQQIDAAQAMAFVRQRRDENDQLFTDLDRTRRQQAFIVSLVTALRHGGALSSPTALRNMLQVAQQSIAVDAGFDLAGFVDHAAALTDSPLELYTLPIREFGGQDTQGEDVNIVDVQVIRTIVHNLFTNGSPPDLPGPTQSRSIPTTLDVTNATSHDGLGSAVERSFSADGLTAGKVTAAAWPRPGRHLRIRRRRRRAHARRSASAYGHRLRRRRTRHGAVDHRRRLPCRAIHVRQHGGHRDPGHHGRRHGRRHPGARTDRSHRDGRIEHPMREVITAKLQALADKHPIIGTMHDGSTIPPTSLA
jgi:LCP family protein required for cell wall assembly